MSRLACPSLNRAHSILRSLTVSAPLSLNSAAASRRVFQHQAQSQFRRSIQSASNATPIALPTHTKVLRYTEVGAPERVIQMCEEQFDASPLAPQQVAIRFLLSPINPSDLNMIEGTYAIKPTLPAIGGNEGVAQVIACGDAVQHLAVGDFVLPHSQQQCGTWRQHARINSNDLIKVPSHLPQHVLATISVNPCTAYRMLRDFVDLKRGDCVIQNGANSAVGQAVIQMCRHWGIQTINVIRKSPEFDQVKQHLLGLGATLVVSDEQLLQRGCVEVMAQQAVPRPRLALNCVGGKSATEIARLLLDSGHIVTYGGMSRKPLTLPTGTLIFQDICAHGFWLTRWYKQRYKCGSDLTSARHVMINEIVELYDQGVLSKADSGFEYFPLDQFTEAMQRYNKPHRNTKILLKP